MVGIVAMHRRRLNVTKTRTLSQPCNAARKRAEVFEDFSSHYAARTVTAERTWGACWPLGSGNALKTSLGRTVRDSCP